MGTRTGTTRAVALAAALAAIGAAAVAPSASATGYGKEPVKVVVSGLNGPFGLDALDHGRFLVAEGGSGEVTKVDRYGHRKVIISDAAGVSGVAAGRHKVFAAIGGDVPAGSKFPATSILRSDYSGKYAKPIANLLAYELKKNPDKQKQFDKDGNPFDTLSNPFSMNLSKYGLLVADGGGNSVIKVNPWTGKPSTFFAPRTVTDVKECLPPAYVNNPGTIGCDPVPTGIAVANGSVYVSTLGAHVPGAGRVYRLNPWNGHVRDVWKGLTEVTGIAVSPNGTIYVSEVFYSVPGEQMPPGRITRISHGKQTHVRVPLPTGLDYHNGNLYASAFSLAEEEGAGQIVKVSDHAFK